MTITITGIDPGNTCGLVTVRINESAHIASWGECTPDELYQMVEDVNDQTFVAMERFVVHPYSAYDPTPMEVCAVVRYICDKRKLRLVEVLPGERSVHQKIVPPIPISTKSKHIEDAYVIALVALKLLSTA